MGDHILKKLITILKTQFEHFFCLHWFQVKWETPIFNLFTTDFILHSDLISLLKHCTLVTRFSFNNQIS